MKRTLHKIARKIRRHHHRRYMKFLQALRLYSGMPVTD